MCRETGGIGLPISVIRYLYIISKTSYFNWSERSAYGPLGIAAERSGHYKLHFFLSSISPPIVTLSEHIAI